MVFLFRHSASFNVFLYPQVIPRDGKDLDARPNVEAQINLLKDQCELKHSCQKSLLMLGCSPWCSLLQICGESKTHSVLRQFFSSSNFLQSILIQEMTIEVDEDFIYSLMDFINSSESAFQDPVDS